MNQWQRLSTVDQFTAHLRAGLLSGHWTETMPGEHRLAEEFAISRKTVKAALQMLEKKGLLVGQGAGRRRKIVLPEDHAPPSLRVAVLFYEKGEEAQDLFTGFQDKLKAAGHTVLHAPKSLTDIGGNMRQLDRMIKQTEADAWVVIAGSKEELQYFIQRQIPVFALFGFWRQLRIAGIAPDLVPAMVAMTRRLIGLGHRRIVLLDQKTTLSTPGSNGSAFLDEMTAHGITTGNYNMPGWEMGFEDFYRCLDSLFARTQPTAIFIFSTMQYFATAQFLLNRGLRVPQDVSLTCMEKPPYSKRFQPSISHVDWNSNIMVNSIVRWTNNISQGKEDIRQTKIDAEFIEGGTVGRVPK